MPKVHFGKNGGAYVMKAGKKVYLSSFGVTETRPGPRAAPAPTPGASGMNRPRSGANDSLDVCETALALSRRFMNDSLQQATRRQDNLERELRQCRAMKNKFGLPGGQLDPSPAAIRFLAEANNTGRPNVYSVIHTALERPLQMYPNFLRYLNGDPPLDSFTRLFTQELVDNFGFRPNEAYNAHRLAVPLLPLPVTRGQRQGFGAPSGGKQQVRRTRLSQDEQDDMLRDSDATSWELLNRIRVLSINSGIPMPRKLKYSDIHYWLKTLHDKKVESQNKLAVVQQSLELCRDALNRELGNI